MATNGDDNNNVFVSCGAFSITIPHLHPMFISDSYNLQLDAIADSIVLLRKMRHNEIK